MEAFLRAKIVAWGARPAVAPVRYATGTQSNAKGTQTLLMFKVAKTLIGGMKHAPVTGGANSKHQPKTRFYHENASTKDARSKA
jgi:hypothetical protein